MIKHLSSGLKASCNNWIDVIYNMQRLPYSQRKFKGSMQSFRLFQIIRNVLLNSHSLEIFKIPLSKVLVCSFHTTFIWLELIDVDKLKHKYKPRINRSCRPFLFFYYRNFPIIIFPYLIAEFLQLPVIKWGQKSIQNYVRNKEEDLEDMIKLFRM